jgi:hypothetical protein
LGPTKMRYKLCCSVLSWKAYAYACHGALVMEVVPDEDDTCKGRSVPNLYVQKSLQAKAVFCFTSGYAG